MPRIAVIQGDGIGREVIPEAVRVLRRAAATHDLEYDLVEWDLGADRFLERGVALTDDEFAALSGDHDAILLGALGDPRVPDHQHARDLLLGLRTRLDLYVNYRPCVLLDPSHSPLAVYRDAAAGPIDIHVFRENTEGLYAGMGGTFKEGTSDEVALQEDVNTRKGVERIVRRAFEFARDEGRAPVTLVDKANAMPAVGGLWRRVFDAVGREYAEIEREAVFVDAMAMDLVRRPGRYSVVVTANLFGDIVSDLAAEITGGLGLAPSANVHPGGHALFEPVHGSAPDIAGRGAANPIAAVRCVELLLGHFGDGAAAASVGRAVRASITAGVTTPDLGGTRTTGEVGAWISDAVGSSGSANDEGAA